jgi:hypothetical protein
VIGGRAARSVGRQESLGNNQCSSRLDAIVLPGNRVIVAEQNNNRVSGRDTSKNGQEIWGNGIQPTIASEAAERQLVVVGRHQIVE